MWLYERNPVRLVHLARERSVPPPAFLLFSVSCCRLIEHLIPFPIWREALPQAERFAEGELDELNWDYIADWYGQTEFVARQVGRALFALYPYSMGAVPNLVGASHHALAVPEYVALALAAATTGPAREGCSAPDHPWHAATRDSYRLAMEAQADLARCVLGPPEVAPVAAHWRTRDVAELVEYAHRSRDARLYPLLHDALIDAGCDDEAGLLDHCRATRHAYGCWALTALLSPSRN